MKIIIATRNEGKMVEVKQILSDLPVKLVALKDIDIKIDINEDGQTIEENALTKARQVCDATNEWVISEDSGLYIQSLDGQPGVLTARWAGDGANEEQIIEHAIKQTRALNQDRRQAYFESAVALISPDGQEWVFTGRTEGCLTHTARGQAGVGMPYDCLFIPDGQNQTFAEMDVSLRNSLEHRTQALAKLKRFIIQAELIEATLEPTEIQVIHGQQQAI
ncbi:MAG: RdgB/HAM1 family non-canonical purine NTP pyrophosphatase [Patescibacteria group bacterium]|jgi:non-canonical purine NTP pyrophosphatase (RdgB/HAM1 family)